MFGKCVRLAYVFGLAVTIVFNAPAAAHAAPQKGKSFADWIIDCEMAPGAKTEKCFASQTQTTKDRKGRLLRFSVGYLGPKGEPVAVAILPLGIYLPAGAAFKVDDGPQVAMTLQSCTSEGCSAGALLSEKTLKELLEGKKMAVGMMPAGSKETVSIAVSMNGFKSAFSSLK